MRVMPFEMKNLRSFPMEKLCFDLKLEALEQMEPSDVYELAKVNQGFQGMLVRCPSIVLGEHVSWIRLCNKRFWIKKFSNSNAIELNVIRHFSFVKKIRSCDQLSFGYQYGGFQRLKREFNEKYIILNNLKSVNRLELLQNSKEALERFFSNFHASIKKEAELVATFDVRDEDDQVIKGLIENFIVKKLEDCEKIWFDCRSEDSVCFYYNAVLKTQIKSVFMDAYSWGSIDLIVQQIVTNGIPSKNPEAAIFLFLCGSSFRMDLSQYPGMRRIDGENRLRLLKQANYLVRNCEHYHGSSFFMEESSTFRRRFDSTRDCICVYDKRYTHVLAFYIPVDEDD